MNLNLINQYGPSLASSDGQTEKRAFPSPAQIAASSPEVLREAVRVGYRAPAIYELAVRVASGELDLESLKTSDLPTLELRKELLKIKDVGPYAAANLLLILGRGDFIPIDSWALKLVSHEWFDGGLSRRSRWKRLLNIGANSRGWRSGFGTGSTRDKMTDIRITGLAWGQMKVSIAGKKQRFKDCKVWPSGAGRKQGRITTRASCLPISKRF
jgi:hypothetical protein